MRRGARAAGPDAFRNSPGPRKGSATKDPGRTKLAIAKRSPRRKETTRTFADRFPSARHKRQTRPWRPTRVRERFRRPDGDSRVRPERPQFPTPCAIGGRPSLPDRNTAFQPGGQAAEIFGRLVPRPLEKVCLAAKHFLSDRIAWRCGSVWLVASVAPAARRLPNKVGETCLFTWSEYERKTGRW